MKLKVNSKKLGQSLLGLSILLLILHLLVLFDIVPPSIIWDTTITDRASVLVSEAIAIFFLAIFMIGLLAKLRWPLVKIFYPLADSFLWIMVVYFFLNAIGHLMADSVVEKLVYAPLIFIFTVLVVIFILAPQAQPVSRRRPKRPSREGRKRQ
ncbi:MAG: hypothetical protein Q4C55_08435 [Eubacterium sp.]|nr:hypothetical protein [Eubacterium sp.]